MSTTITPPPLLPQHVPAWRRLGLKLKYANDPAEDSATHPQISVQSLDGNAPSHTANHGRKRSRTHDDHSSDVTPVKRSKAFTDSSRGRYPSVAHTASSSDALVDDIGTASRDSFWSLGGANVKASGHHIKLDAEE